MVKVRGSHLLWKPETIGGALCGHYALMAFGRGSASKLHLQAWEPYTTGNKSILCGKSSRDNQHVVVGVVGVVVVVVVAFRPGAGEVA